MVQILPVRQVVKSNETQRVNDINTQAQIEIIQKVIERLEDRKADVYTIEIIMHTLDKIDYLQEKVK